MSPDPKHHDDLSRKNRRTALVVGVVVLAMVGMAFASVPLYKLFCSVTGFGGTTQVAVEADLPEEISTRTIIVQFNADTARDLFWDFRPKQRRITTHVGEKTKIFYVAENLTARKTAGTAIYNVTPQKAGRYFHKIQCFCFDSQTLGPGEKVDMPVLFYIDPEILENRNMDDVTTITLSYTFFKEELAELEQESYESYN